MVREGADPAQKQRNPLVCGLRGRARRARFNGVDEDRTHNLLDATEALFQLSYHPQQSWSFMLSGVMGCRKATRPCVGVV